MTNETLCIIILIVACIVTLSVLWYKIQKEGLRKIAIEFILIAEKTFESGEGKEKMYFVIDKIINVLPLPFRIILTSEDIEKFIQYIFDEIKEVLEYGNK